MMPRIVLITNDNLHGQRVLKTLYERGILLDAVLYLTGSFGPPQARRGRGPIRRLAGWPRSIVSAMRRKWRFHRRRKASYTPLCKRLVGTGEMNSRQLIRDLRALAPDFVILGGGGILRPAVIETARIGVLNAHPALLPWIRGCGIVGHSLEQGVALGATLHWVDRGIDTGAVVERRLVSIPRGPATLAALELAADELAAEMLADAVESLVRGGAVPDGAQQSARYPLFRWPTEDGKRAHEALAAAGRAHDLFEAWRPLCEDGARLTLHADLAPPATIALQPSASPAPASFSDEPSSSIQT
jgi:folate-dependent phosphoribosylglycinamide formyltransferase PurN